MNLLKISVLSIATVGMSISVLASEAAAAWGPGKGDILFDGGWFNDTYFTWYNLNGRKNDGTFETDNPGFEMDVTYWKLFNKSCTTFNELPYGYDDCPTAGVDEDDPNYWNFGFGTFRLKSVEVLKTYYASWTFRNTREVSASINFAVGIQETSNFCFPPIDTIWCQFVEYAFTIQETKNTAIDGVLFTRSWDHPEW